jgi:hypothetical protein
LRRKFLEYITSADPEPDRAGALGAVNDDEASIRVMTPSRMRELLAQGNPLLKAIWEDATSGVE